MFVANKMPTSLSAEAYRNLRTNIKFLSVDKPIKTIVVTSSIIGEGKTTVAGNLAYILSQDGAKVLVIDCNLRNPSMHNNFFVSNEKGLTDFLIKNCELDSILKKIEDSLFLITAGTIPPNPSEILGIDLMQELLNKVSVNFDYVILDTPAVIPVTDTLILSAKSDATLIVVKSRTVKAKIVKQSYEKLASVKANIIGTVLNETDKAIENKYYGCYEKGNKKNNKNIEKNKHRG